MSDSDDGIFFGPMTLKEIKKYALRESVSSQQNRSFRQRRCAHPKLIKKEKISTGRLEIDEVISISDTSTESDVLIKNDSGSETSEKENDEVFVDDNIVIDLCSDDSYNNSLLSESENMSLNKLSMKTHVISSERNDLPSVISSDGNDVDSPEIVFINTSCSRLKMHENSQNKFDFSKTCTPVKTNSLSLNSTYVLDFSTVLNKENSSRNLILLEEENVEASPDLSRNENVTRSDILQTDASPGDKLKDVSRSEDVRLQERVLHSSKIVDNDNDLSEINESIKDDPASPKEQSVDENSLNKTKCLYDKDDNSGDQFPKLYSILNMKYIDDSLTSSNITGIHYLNITTEHAGLDNSSNKNNLVELEEQARLVEDGCLVSKAMDGKPADVQELNYAGMQEDLSNDLNAGAEEDSNKECNDLVAVDNDINIEINSSTTTQDSNDLNKLPDDIKTNDIEENNMNLLTNSLHADKTFNSTFSDNSGFNDTLEGMENIMKYGLEYMTFEKKKSNLTSNITTDYKIQDSITENSVHSVTEDIYKQVSSHKSTTEHIETDEASYQSVSSCTTQEETGHHEMKNTFDKSVESLHLSKDSELYKTLLRQISDLYVDTDENDKVEGKLIENVKLHLSPVGKKDIPKHRSTVRKFFQTPVKITTEKLDSVGTEHLEVPKSNTMRIKYFQTPVKGTPVKSNSGDMFKMPSKVTPVSDRKKTDIKEEQIGIKKKYLLSSVQKSGEKYKNIISPVGLYIKKSASSGLIENVHVKSKQVPPHNLKENIPVFYQYKCLENISDETKSVLTKRSSNERLSIENIKKIDSDGDFGDELKVGAVQDVESKIAETGAFAKENKLENNENYTPTIPKCVYRSASEVKMKEDESPKVIIPPSIKKYFQTPTVVIKHESRVKSGNKRPKLLEDNTDDSAFMLENSSSAVDKSLSTPDVSIRVTKSALR